MPVSFLSSAQRAKYACYPDNLPSDLITNHFFLDDQDRERIARKRGNANRLGYAIQLSTVRFLGTFINNLMDIPQAVLERIASQINISNAKDHLSNYQASEKRWRHNVEIRKLYGCREFTEKKSPIYQKKLTNAQWKARQSPKYLFCCALL